MAKDKKETTTVDEAPAVVDSTSVKEEANQIAEAGKKVDETSTEEVEEVTEAVVETTEEEIIEEVIVDSLEAVKEAETERNSFEYKKGRYVFTADTPEVIRIFGEVFTQKELLSNDELMQELIDSKCVFITKL